MAGAFGSLGTSVASSLGKEVCWFLRTHVVPLDF